MSLTLFRGFGLKSNVHDLPSGYRQDGWSRSRLKGQDP